MYLEIQNIWIFGGLTMVILKLKMDNVLAFNDFEINFSYPVKLRKTLIPDENLNGKPSFK